MIRNSYRPAHLAQSDDFAEERCAGHTAETNRVETVLVKILGGRGEAPNLDEGMSESDLGLFESACRNWPGIVAEVIGAPEPYSAATHNVIALLGQYANATRAKIGGLRFASHKPGSDLSPIWELDAERAKIYAALPAWARW